MNTWSKIKCNISKTGMNAKRASKILLADLSTRVLLLDYINGNCSNKEELFRRILPFTRTNRMSEIRKIIEVTKTILYKEVIRNEDSKSVGSS